MDTIAGPVALSDADIERLGLLPFVDEAHGIAGLLAPQVGGELASLRVRWQSEWVETLYGACQYDITPLGWRGRAPLLWPTVGRTCTDELAQRLRDTGEAFSEGTYRLGHQTLTMPIHGFVMNMPWKPLPSEGVAGLLQCVDTPETRQWYPFGFRVTVAYQTGFNGLRITYTIEAGENADPMPMSIGNHISLKVPLADRGTFDAVTFHSLATGYRGLQVPSVFDGTTTPMDFRCVPLAETAVHNIVTCGYSWDDAEVALWCPESFGMGVGQRILEMPGGIGSFSPEEACYFVLWGDPQEGYFCPEPWVGGPNAFNEHKGLVQLSAGERFVWEMLLRPMFDPPW